MGSALADLRQVCPGVIGGLVVKIAGLTIDNSIRTQLVKLRGKLKGDTV